MVFQVRSPALNSTETILLCVCIFHDNLHPRCQKLHPKRTALINEDVCFYFQISTGESRHESSSWAVSEMCSSTRSRTACLLDVSRDKWRSTRVPPPKLENQKLVPWRPVFTVATRMRGYGSHPSAVVSIISHSVTTHPSFPNTSMFLVFLLWNSSCGVFRLMLWTDLLHKTSGNTHL